MDKIVVDKMVMLDGKKQEINEKETPNEREEQTEKTEYVQGE